MGTGSCWPRLAVTNDQLAEFLDTSDEWIRTRTGICERRVLSGEETLSGLAEQAARRALMDSGVEASELDLILVSTVQGEASTPGQSCIVAERIGAACPAMDINVACPGFIYALDIADAYIKSGKAHRVLVVAAEAMSHLADWTDRATCVLFGDGAGAAVVEAGEGLVARRLTCQPNLAILNAYPHPGNSPYHQGAHPMSPMHMAGQEVYRFAVSHSVADLQAVMAEAGVTAGQVDHFLLHQANQRILNAVRTRLDQPEEKFPSNIASHGNTASASVAILLDELNRAGRLKQGDLIAMSVFGAGLTTGACLLRWTR